MSEVYFLSKQKILARGFCLFIFWVKRRNLHIWAIFFSKATLFFTQIIFFQKHVHTLSRALGVTKFQTFCSISKCELESEDERQAIKRKLWPYFVVVYFLGKKTPFVFWGDFYEKQHFSLAQIFFFFQKHIHTFIRAIRVTKFQTVCSISKSKLENEDEIQAPMSSNESTFQQTESLLSTFPAHSK